MLECQGKINVEIFQIHKAFIEVENHWYHVKCHFKINSHNNLKKLTKFHYKKTHI